jgi:hypothetical protein
MSKSPCVTSVFHDSEVEKKIGKKFAEMGSWQKKWENSQNL